MFNLHGQQDIQDSHNRVLVSEPLLRPEQSHKSFIQTSDKLNINVEKQPPKKHLAPTKSWQNRVEKKTARSVSAKSAKKINADLVVKRLFPSKPK